MNVYSELKQAQLENVASPSGEPRLKGRIMRMGNDMYLDDGTSAKKVVTMPDVPSIIIQPHQVNQIANYKYIGTINPTATTTWTDLPGASFEGFNVGNTSGRWMELAFIRGSINFSAYGYTDVSLRIVMVDAGGTTAQAATENTYSMDLSPNVGFVGFPASSYRAIFGSSTYSTATYKVQIKANKTQAVEIKDLAIFIKAL